MSKSSKNFLVSRRAALGTIPLSAVAGTLLGESSVVEAAADVSVETWPGVPYNPSYRALIQQGINTYPLNDHVRFLVNYDPLGSYFKWGDVEWSASNPSYRFDVDGVPQTRYEVDGVYNYYDHPVTFCRYALHLHDRVIRYGETQHIPLIQRCVDRLLATQSSSGAFLYPFPYSVYGYNFPAGWTSAMGQGIALSILRRAYALAPDARYIAAGNAAITPLTRLVANGGVQTSLADLHPSLSGHLWLEEFPTIPASYKLNGFMFTLFGLYDWWQRSPNAVSPNGSYKAKTLFLAGSETVGLALPYFDLRGPVAGFSTPDCRYVFTPGLAPRIQPGYHRVHIYQLHALAQITQGDTSASCSSYEKLWSGYVNSVV